MARTRSSGSDERGDRERLYQAIRQLQRLTELMERRRQQLARTVGLSPQQWRVLEEIGREDFMPSLFARSQACTPAAVSRTLRQLSDRKLVRASIASGDARKREYSLTAAGRRVLEKLRTAREEALEAVWGRFGAEQLELFGRFGGELADRLAAYAAAADEAPGSRR